MSDMVNSLRLNVVLLDLKLFTGGFMRSGGVLYIELREKFHDSAANTAWVISLAVTVRMLFGKYESLLEQGFITTMFLICAL